MATFNRYWTVTGITSAASAVGMAIMLVGVGKLSIPLAALATSIVVAAAAVGIPSILAAQRQDARAKREADASSAGGPPA